MFLTFPILANAQVVLLRVDKNTGHVLDENFLIATTENQKVWTIFENLDIATNIAHSIIKIRTDIECSIFDGNQNLVRFVSPNQ